MPSPPNTRSSARTLTGASPLTGCSAQPSKATPTRHDAQRRYAPGIASTLSPDQAQQLAPDLIDPRRPCVRQYSPHRPHPKQAALLLLANRREVLFGGAAGGGKTDALLMDALQYVCVPGYAAVLLRQNYPMLAREDGLIPRAEEWLSPTDAVWRAVDKRWEFPSGASLTIAAVQRDEDRYNFAGPAYQYAGFDELTNWRTLKVYKYIGFSRLRQPKPSPDLAACPRCGLTLADVPLRTRGMTNPGGPGHDQVYERFIEPWELWKEHGGPAPARPFLPSRLRDNPSLAYDSYLAGLRELDPIEQARLIDGDWNVRESGGMFDPAKFRRTDSRAPDQARRVRYWDFAATVPSAANPDPDWTVGALIAHHDGWWWVEHMVRLRDTPAKVEQKVRSIAEADGRGVPVVIEQEPGSSGVRTVEDFARRVLPAGWRCHGDKVSGSKIERARGWSAAVGNGLAHVVSGGWDVQALLDEHESFPNGGHDDIVDACAGGLNWLASKGGGMRFRD